MLNNTAHIGRIVVRLYNNVVRGELVDTIQPSDVT
jgi:hypothetical protein